MKSYYFLYLTTSQQGKSKIKVIELKFTTKKCFDSESKYLLTRVIGIEELWLFLAISSSKHNLQHHTTLVFQLKVAKNNQCSISCLFYHIMMQHDQQKGCNFFWNHAIDLINVKLIKLLLYYNNFFKGYEICYKK